MNDTMTISELTALVLRERAQGNFDHFDNKSDEAGAVYAEALTANAIKIIASMKAKKRPRVKKAAAARQPAD